MNPSLSGLTLSDHHQDAARLWRRIYVGVLTHVMPHPNADHEMVVEVDTGWGRLIVVTGGPHVEVGRKVAVALPGARVFDPSSATPRIRKLKKGRIRGVMSEGMLCSAKELGLSGDHSAIYVLDAEAPVGAPLAAWLHSPDARMAARSVETSHDGRTTCTSTMTRVRLAGAVGMRR